MVDNHVIFYAFILYIISGGDFMDVFEKHFNMLRKSEKKFITYYKNSKLGIPMPKDFGEDISKKGKDLLSQNQVVYFRQVRSMHYQNVIDKEIGDWEYLEWLACLEERVLLMYVIPLFSKVLEVYPMLYGGNCEWQVLYEITIIDNSIWMKYPEWKKFYQKIVCNSIFRQDGKCKIKTDYLCQFERFICK